VSSAYTAPPSSNRGLTLYLSGLTSRTEHVSVQPSFMRRGAWDVSSLTSSTRLILLVFGVFLVVDHSAASPSAVGSQKALAFSASPFVRASLDGGRWSSVAATKAGVLPVSSALSGAATVGQLIAGRRGIKTISQTRYAHYYIHVCLIVWRPRAHSPHHTFMVSSASRKKREGRLFVALLPLTESHIPQQGLNAGNCSTCRGAA